MIVHLKKQTNSTTFITKLNTKQQINNQNQQIYVSIGPLHDGL